MRQKQKPNTRGDYDETENCFCKNDFLSTKRRPKCEKIRYPLLIFKRSIYSSPCRSTGNFRVLVHDKCNLNKRKKNASFVPIIFHNFSGYECYLFFEKLLLKETIEKDIEINEQDIIAKSSENKISVKKGPLKILDPYRILDGRLDNLSKTSTSFPSLHAK